MLPVLPVVAASLPVPSLPFVVVSTAFAAAS
jgi:hypothetical protein